MSAKIHHLKPTARIIPIRTATPLNCEEIVSDDTLRQLAKDSPERAVGELNSEDQSILAMTLPDICGELLAHRAAARGKLS